MWGFPTAAPPFTISTQIVTLEQAGTEQLTENGMDSCPYNRDNAFGELIILTQIKLRVTKWVSLCFIQ